MEHAGSFEAKSGISEVSLVISDYGGTAAKRAESEKKLTHLSADLILSLVKLFLCFSKSTEKGWGACKGTKLLLEIQEEGCVDFIEKGIEEPRIWKILNWEISDNVF